MSYSVVATPSHELDRAGVDAGDVGDGALGRVFHGDAAHARHETPEPRLELVAAGIPIGRSRQMRERVALDCVDEPARRALGRNEIVPAPRREMTSLTADAGHLGGNRVESAEIVEQPGVDAVGSEGRLNAGDIHSTSIAWLRRYNQSTPEFPTLCASRRGA